MRTYDQWKTEEDEAEDALLWCEIHEFSYRESYGCEGCFADHVDRQIDDRMNKKHGLD